MRKKGVSPFQLIESLLQKSCPSKTHTVDFRRRDSVSALNLGGIRRARSIIQSPDLSPISEVRHQHLERFCL